MQAEIVDRFHSALPHLRAWIDRLLHKYAHQTRFVSALGFTRLASCFPTELLARANVAMVDRVPFPPVADFGLPEFAPLQIEAISGITFKNTFFLRQGCASESLHFHEMVHVIQWARLGVEKFLLAYGLGLLAHGYEQSPLEKTAYDLQRRFDSGTLPPDVVRVIETEADAVWKQAEPIVSGF